MFRTAATFCNVACRDIVEGLRTCGCTSSSQFEWQRQLRFEFDTALEDVVIRQVSALKEA